MTEASHYVNYFSLSLLSLSLRIKFHVNISVTNTQKSRCKNTTRHGQKQKTENYPLTSAPSCQHTTIGKKSRERTTINRGTTMISITTTQEEHCNKTGHITNKNCKKKNSKSNVTVTV
jgi:hypothetical protein